MKNLISCCAFVVALVFAAPSCKKDNDACYRVVCATGGQCVDGTCVYDDLCAAVQCPAGSICVNGICQQADPCNGINCLNGGTCVSGACNCPAGYEGTDCGTEVRTKYIGAWQTANETCTLFSPGGYTITIAAATSGILNVIISNIYNAGYNITAAIDGNNITIPSQSLSLGTIQGNGTINGNSIVLSYTITFSGSTEICANSVFTKQ